MTYSKLKGSIWFDGQFVPWQDAKVHVLTHTLHYGVGIYEGLRAYETDKGPAIFRLQAHTDRFFDSAKIIKMPMPFTKEVLNQMQTEIVGRNKLASAYIRPLCFYGDEGMGLHAESLESHVMIASWAWGAYLGKDSLQKGVSIMTSSFRRINANCALNKAKANGNYLNSVMALQEATAGGFDEALLLDDNGFVAEGSGENFFMIKNGELFTPPLATVLAGITRETIIHFAKALGITVHECFFTRDQVYTADEAFFTGTAAEVTPVVALDGRSIGTGKPGELTTQLQQRYFDVVQGRVPEYEHWLTYC